MSGADGSFGKSDARTLQYSTVRPLTTCVTRDADSTRPPRVGRLIADDGIAVPASSAHLGAVLTVAAAGLCPKTTVALTNAVVSASIRPICEPPDSTLCHQCIDVRH